MQTNIYGRGTSSFFQTYRWHSNSNKIPFWLWSNTKHLYFRCFFGLRFWVGIYLWVTPQNGELHGSFSFSDLKCVRFGRNGTDHFWITFEYPDKSCDSLEVRKDTNSIRYNTADSSGVWTTVFEKWYVHFRILTKMVTCNSLTWQKTLIWTLRLNKECIAKQVL